MLMFSVNFGPEQFNCMLPAAFVEVLPEDELRYCSLIEKSTMLMKLDVKIALIANVPMVRPPPPQA